MQAPIISVPLQQTGLEATCGCDSGMASSGHKQGPPKCFAVAGILTCCVQLTLRPLVVMQISLACYVGIAQPGAGSKWQERTLHLQLLTPAASKLLNTEKPGPHICSSLKASQAIRMMLATWSSGVVFPCQACELKAFLDPGPELVDFGTGIEEGSSGERCSGANTLSQTTGANTLSQTTANCVVWFTPCCFFTTIALPDHAKSLQHSISLVVSYVVVSL